MIAGVGVLLDHYASHSFWANANWPCLRALLVGFPVAIGLTVLATLLGRVMGLVEPSMLDSEHPLTSFISSPDLF